jgi:DnaJ-class molecular chaperone
MRLMITLQPDHLRPDHLRKETTMSFEGPPGKHIEATCPQCRGNGKIKESGKDVTCKLCRGTGKVPK